MCYSLLFLDFWSTISRLMPSHSKLSSFTSQCLTVFVKSRQTVVWFISWIKWDTYSVTQFCTASAAAAAATKSLQSCPTLWDPRDGSPSGSPVPGILQARTLKWVAISFSNAWKWKGKVKSLSGVWLFTTPWTSAHLALPSMRFSRQEYWSGVPLPSPFNPT